MGIVTGYLSQLVSSGIKLLNNGTAVSSSNPLPVSASQLPSELGTKRVQESISVVNAAGTSTAVELMLGRLHNLKLSQAAVSAQYARVQVYNPVGSGVELVIVAFSAYAGTAGTHVYSAYAVDISTALGTAATLGIDTNYKLGGDIIKNIQLLGRNSAGAIPTVGLVCSGSHTSITSPGTSIGLASGLTSIPEGQCLELAIGTLNVTINVTLTVQAIPT